MNPEGPKTCKLLRICQEIRQLQSQQFMCSKVEAVKTEKSKHTFPIETMGSQPTLMMLKSDQAERTFLRAIDHSKIPSWEHFEYILCFIIENRCLRVYQAYL